MRIVWNELEVLRLCGQVEVFILIFVFVIEVAEAGGEGCGRENGRGSGNRIALVVDLHAERQAHLREDFLDLVQRLAAEVLGLEHLGFGLLNKFADGGDVCVLQAVVAADGEFEFFDRAVEVLVASRRAVERVVAGFHLLFKVDEDAHVVPEQLGGESERVGREHGAVGPDLDGELVVVGDLTETSSLDEVVDLADGRVDRVDRNDPEAEVGIEVLVGGDVSTTALEAHLHIDLAAFGDGTDVDVLIENLNVAVSLDHAGGNDARRIGAKVESLWAVACELEGNLLEVEDDVGCVLNDSADGLELVQHALDTDGGDCRALDRGEQGTAKGIADRGTEAALKWLSGKFSIFFCECFGVDGKTLGFLKASPKHWVFLLSVLAAMHSAAGGWFCCGLSCDKVRGSRYWVRGPEILFGAIGIRGAAKKMRGFFAALRMTNLETTAKVTC